MKKIIVPVSGGKDSQACLILALLWRDVVEEVEVVPVFNDTGWDHPGTYAHLDYMRKKSELSIAVTVRGRGADTVPELIKEYGRFPWGVGRFCTKELKQRPFKRWLDTVEGEGEIWLGVRTGESGQRARKYQGLTSDETHEMNDMFPREYPKRLSSRFVYRLPVIDWTTEEVFSLSKRFGWKMNPLYAQGFDRVGCFPCLLAGKKTQELAFRSEFGRKQFAIIRELEQEIGEEYKFQDKDLTCEVCKI